MSTEPAATPDWRWEKLLRDAQQFAAVSPCKCEPGLTGVYCWRCVFRPSV